MAEPAYTFTLLSLDKTKLDCRIYHPQNLPSILEASCGALKGAVVAHPYAPLGGSYGDPVVLSVTETLLEQGYIVGTFNFRGAGASEGKTSWSGRGETSDYMSVAGFMIYYTQHLREHDGDSRLTTIPSVGDVLPDSGTGPHNMPLLLAGYSYGSLVLARLPGPADMLKRFQNAPLGTAGAEIIMRAHTLARRTAQVVQEQRSSRRSRARSMKSDAPMGEARASPVTVGGEETNLAEHRRSKDSSRSASLVRKSVEVPQRIKQHIQRRSSSQKCHMAEERGSTTAHLDGLSPTISVNYLLISPVIMPFTNMLLPPGPPTPSISFRKRTADGSAGASFLHHTTLAVFGTSDVFTSSGRLRSWAERQAKDSAVASFSWEQIEEAGHFWREDGVMRALQEHIASWLVRVNAAR